MSNPRIQQILAQSKKILAQADIDLSARKMQADTAFNHALQIDKQNQAGQAAINNKIVDLYAEVLSMNE